MRFATSFAGRRWANRDGGQPGPGAITGSRSPFRIAMGGDRLTPTTGGEIMQEKTGAQILQDAADYIEANGLLFDSWESEDGTEDLPPCCCLIATLRIMDGLPATPPPELNGDVLAGSVALEVACLALGAQIETGVHRARLGAPRRARSPVDRHGMGGSLRRHRTGEAQVSARRRPPRYRVAPSRTRGWRPRPCRAGAPPGCGEVRIMMIEQPAVAV